MIIKDSKGSYELKVDAARGIVYETFNGFLNMESMHNDYVNKVFPLIKGKKWTKCSDLRNYKTTTLNDGDTHLEWCTKNGMVPGAIIVASAIVKMQMNRLGKTSNSDPVAFDNLEEADAWLKSQGF
ncbi:hypothetical protein [Alkaliphilus oremlandii]|uniref:STAS/SEC14 domain-containing protein n=1 Tax=Alkaliphilus oremlandii (strain OhILAs) TaxID=350688 RepID=A8MEV6_ALKOO|nr:hypothetical protein [Alkaliphilus oremlandii]ABW18435.1 hypothetical protein Clos_0888 [Alkaliphilus oremlandii OhILAs]